MGRLEQSVSGLLNTANSALDQVTALTKAILCLPKALRTLSKGFYAISAKTIAQEIIGSVAQVVGQIVDGIIGSVVDAIEAQLARVLEYLKDIDTIIDEVKDFVKGIKTRTPFIGKFYKKNLKKDTKGRFCYNIMNPYHIIFGLSFKTLLPIGSFNPCVSRYALK